MKLHTTLQDSVDRELQKTGFLPETSANAGRVDEKHDRWQCSDKQRDLIIKITEEHRLDKNAVDQLARDRFGKSVRTLNKLEASGLIDELLEQTGQKSNNGRRFNGRSAPVRST